MLIANISYYLKLNYIMY